MRHAAVRTSLPIEALVYLTSLHHPSRNGAEGGTGRLAKKNDDTHGLMY
jgi:hypothetical protein